MILDCEYCYNHFVIKADDRDVKVNFCPHCGEPIEEEEEKDDLDFNYYEND